MRNSNFGHKAQKCFSGYVLPLKIYSHITSSMKKSNFGINGVADRNPLLCAECCFGMQICFWYGALLHCTIVHYLAPPWSQTDLPWPITTRNFRGGGATYTIEHLWHLANVPCKHADVGKSKKREKIKQLIMASMLAPLAHTLRSEQLQHSQMFRQL